jgi:hypothetical protein
MVPRPPFSIKPKRLLGGKLMTIAIGALCAEGVIVAADTRIVGTDGSTSVGVKVRSEMSNTGCYAIANATNDGNAANTLVPDILDDLKRGDPQNFYDLETNVRATMSTWAAQHPHGTAPSVQLILGAYIDQLVLPDLRAGGGSALYYCETPNTMVRKEPTDDSRGYVAIGVGATITDPIYRTLFYGSAPLRDRLIQIGYMMYRAKKDMGAFCGGITNAVLVKHKHEFPQWIDNHLIGFAESSGLTIDGIMRSAVEALICTTDENKIKAVGKELTDQLYFNGKGLRLFMPSNSQTSGDQ